MSDEILGVIAPHPPIMVAEVGGARADVTAASAASMRAAAALLAAFDPDTIVVMSPHAPALADALAVDASPVFRGDLGEFSAREVSITTDGDPVLARAILEHAETVGLAVLDRASERRLQPGWLDHGVIVPMSFIDRDGRWPLVVLSLSLLPFAQHRRLGAAVAEAAHAVGRRIAFVASGDCSHRLTPDAPAGYSPEAAEFDRWLVGTVRAGDLGGLVGVEPGLDEAAGECGLRSFIALGGAIPDAETRVLSYEGPWGVGYLAAVAGTPGLLERLDAAVTPESGSKGGMPGDEESAPVALARRALEAWVREGRVLDERPGDPLLSGRAGAFVSLHEDGELRGCIGTILATRETLTDEIVHNAVEASSHDPRFPPVRAEELPRIDISVDVLHAPEGVSGLEELDPKRFGVIVSCGPKRGLLLPDLEGVETCEHQVSIAMRKGGISPSEPVRLERFCVDRYT